MALHALAYCERLFYLEEVEEIRIADARVYAGRTLHEELRQDEEAEDGEWSSVELASERLGIRGKVDALRRRDGTIIPYEHKRGRAREEEGGHAAWASDALQITAYAVLLEEAHDTPIAEGRVRYHASAATVRVPIDEAARTGLRLATERARELRCSTERPPVAANDRLCSRCSLAPACLPEEERLAQDADWDPVRLFPAERDRKTIHVQEPGARVSRSSHLLAVIGTETERRFPVNEVGCIVLHGYTQITTQALHLCAEKEIQVHWVSAAGRYIAGLSAGAGGVQRRVRQYRALGDAAVCLELARRTAAAKAQTALRYVLRSTRGAGSRPPAVLDAIQTMRAAVRGIGRAKESAALRGHEGNAARGYFAAVPHLLRDEVPSEMRPDGRNRRPPRDRFNALLSFGYGLLYQAVLRAIITVGLEPALGYFHTPRSAAHPLVLDVMELFRVSAWDVPLIGSVNRLSWDPQADFEIAGERVWLSGGGRRKAIELFERRLQEVWRHPVVGHSLAYERLIELEVRLLEKEWSGSPGLFAQMRLR